MSWLAVSWALAIAPGPADPHPWRVIDRPELHLGVRPAAFVDNEAGPDQPLEVGVGVTVQLTVFAP